MSWRRWRVGAAVSIILSLFVALMGLSAGMHWQAFLAVLGAALVTHFGAFLKDHPPEQITFDADAAPSQAATPPQRIDTMIKTLLLCGLAAASLTLSGCTTVTGTSPTGQPTQFSTLDTNTVVAAINLVVPAGVRLAVAHDTNAAPYFAQASIIIRTLAGAGTVDPAQVKASLSAISIRELRSPTAVQAENAALALYQTFAAQAVSQQVNKVAWLQPVLAAMGNAMAAGLAGP